MSDYLTSFHQDYALALMRLGMPMIKLYETDSDGICQCQKGRECGNSGKHPKGRTVRTSLIQTEGELTMHVANGGNLGVILYYPNKPLVPKNPLRLYAFDDDDGTGIKWLADRGITSPWIVSGRRGNHVFVLLPDDTPDLVTRNNVFFKERHEDDEVGVPYRFPKMDLRLTGFMVLPMNNQKRVHVDGQLLDHATKEFLEHFASIESLAAWLPKFDPRCVIPGVHEREIPPAVISDNAKSIEKQSHKPRVGKSPKKGTRERILHNTKFSNTRPAPEAYFRGYAEIPYYERKRMAKSHASRVLPSIEGQSPWKRLVKVIDDLILHYGVSDQDAWLLVKTSFNPRCKYADGKPYPWLKSDVRQAIEWSHKPDAFSTLSKFADQEEPLEEGQIPKLKWFADSDRTKERLHQKERAVNMKRLKVRAEIRDDKFDLLRTAALNIDYLNCLGINDRFVLPLALRRSEVRFQDLYNDLSASYFDLTREMPSRKLVGMWLGSMGLRTVKGMVKAKVDPLQDSSPALLQAAGFSG